MKSEKKLYIPPTAELILLAPLEAIAETTSDKIAMNQWGKTVVNNASIVGSNRTMWNEDGTITSGS